MTSSLAIAIAQINPTVGALAANCQKIIEFSQQVENKADIVVFPELALCGYPPEDLLLRPAFVRDCMKQLHALAEKTKNMPAILVGAPWQQGDYLYNSAVLLAEGEIKAVTAKKELPNYGVFDEQRVFVAGAMPYPMLFQGVKLGVFICEDMWHPAVAKSLTQQGATILLCLNGSPFERGKPEKRLDIATSRVRENGLPLVYANLVGGQDELVFDGRSFVLQASGQPAALLPAWQEAVEVTTWLFS